MKRSGIIWRGSFTFLLAVIMVCASLPAPAAGPARAITRILCNIMGINT